MNTMSYKCYEAVVEESETRTPRIFHGEVMNTRDVITFQGRSVDDLKAALAESVEDYLACCRERGEKPEKPTVRQLAVLRKRRDRQSVAESPVTSASVSNVGLPSALNALYMVSLLRPALLAIFAMPRARAMSTIAAVIRAGSPSSNAASK